MVCEKAGVDSCTTCIKFLDSGQRAALSLPTIKLIRKRNQLTITYLRLKPTTDVSSLSLSTARIESFPPIM